MEILKTVDIKKIYDNYKNPVTVLQDISFTINEGEIVVIFGPSGSGKSTLLNILSGIDKVSSGKIYFEEEDITNFSFAELLKYRKDNIGFIFQTFNLVPSLTVYENICLGAKLSDNPYNIDDILKSIKMLNSKDKYPAQLSGGEMQKVAIARAIVKNSKILFCDEPTGSLDEENGKKIYSLLQNINKEYKITIIIVTHNSSVGDIANTVVKMNSGKIVKITKNKNIKNAIDLRWV